VWLVGAVGGPAWAEYQRVEGPAAKKALTWERVCAAVAEGS
jgi:hypothetical protein